MIVCCAYECLNGGCTVSQTERSRREERLHSVTGDKPTTGGYGQHEGMNSGASDLGWGGGLKGNCVVLRDRKVACAWAMTIGRGGLHSLVYARRGALR